MFVKICGMSRQADLDVAWERGAALCGFIFHPKSPRYVDPSHVATLDTHGLLRVGVFVRQGAAEICDIARVARLDLIQLHGAQDEACADTVGRERVIRVLWPEKFASPEAFQDALDRSWAHCACVLLDAGTSGGGSGRAFARDLLGDVRLDGPWMLAGGLAPGCASRLERLRAEGIRPTGLDFNSGLEEAPAMKSPALMALAFAELEAHGLGPDRGIPAVFARRLEKPWNLG